MPTKNAKLAKKGGAVVAAGFALADWLAPVVSSRLAPLLNKMSSLPIPQLLSVALLLFLVRRDVMPYFHPHDQNNYFLFLSALLGFSGFLSGNFEHTIVMSLLLLAVLGILREYPWYTQPHASIFGHLDASYILAPLGVFLLRLSPLQAGGAAAALCALALFRLLPRWCRHSLVMLLEPPLVKGAASASLAALLLHRYYLKDTDGDGDKDWADISAMADTNRDRRLGPFEVCLFLLPVLVFAAAWLLLSSFVGSELRQELQVPYARKRPAPDGAAAGGGRGGGRSPSIWGWMSRQVQEWLHRDACAEARRLAELEALYARQEAERLNSLRLREEAARAGSWTWTGLLGKLLEDVEWSRRQNEFLVRQRAEEANRRRIALHEAREAAREEAQHREDTLAQARRQQAQAAAVREAGRKEQELQQELQERRRREADEARRREEQASERRRLQAARDRAEAEAQAELRLKGARDRAELERRRVRELAEARAAREAQDERLSRAAREAAEAEARRQLERRAAQERAEQENRRQRDALAASEAAAARAHAQRQLEERRRAEEVRSRERAAAAGAGAGAGAATGAGAVGGGGGGGGADVAAYELRQKAERDAAEARRKRTWF